MENLRIQYIGGPLDGEEKVLMRPTPTSVLDYPPEIRIPQEDNASVGLYYRSVLARDGSMRYVWTYNKREGLD